MAIVSQREVWEDYLLLGLKKKASSPETTDSPGILSTGLFGLVENPKYTEGEQKWRVPYINDLQTVLGTDQRIRKDVDMTLKSGSGGAWYGPLCHYGDTVKDQYISRLQNGLDLLTKYGPQVVDYNFNMIASTAVNSIHGAFAPGGGLATSNTYGDGTSALTETLLANAKANIFGRFGGRLSMLFVDPLVYANMVGNKVLTYTASSDYGSSVVNSGLLPTWQSLRVMNQGDIATGVQFYFAADDSTDVVTTKKSAYSSGTLGYTAENHGFVDGDVVRVELASSGVSDALPAGLTAGTDYYVISATTGTFKLSLTSGGSAVDITDTGTGTFRVTSRSQFYSYVAAPGSCYLGYQKRAVVESGYLPLTGAGTWFLKWVNTYGAGVYGTSYIDTDLPSDHRDEGPSRESLAVGTTWAKEYDAERILIMRIRHKLA